MTERYDCDQCGACCKRTLIVEADWYDLEREPAIKDADPRYRDESLENAREQLADGMRVILMACGTDRGDQNDVHLAQAVDGNSSAFPVFGI